MTLAVGIHGLGVELPAQVRKNDWWPAAVVEGWKATLANAEIEPGQGSPATRIPDPFMGALERRVLPEGSKLGEMECAAARVALANAKVPAAEIDVLFVDDGGIVGPIHPLFHLMLGLRPDCLSSTFHAGGSAYPLQLQFAEQLISGGHARFALLIQSMRGMSGLDAGDPLSAQIGSGATAVVLGPVAAGRGLLGVAQYANGALPDLLPGGRSLTGDQESANLVLRNYHRVFAVVASHADELLDRALAEAKLTRADIDFWATNQVSAWSQSELQSRCGVQRAAQVNAFPRMGNLMDACIPMSLDIAINEGLVRSGTTIAMLGVGSEGVASCAILRWGV